jgi:hypothetical protein
MRWLAWGLLLVIGVCAPAVAEPSTVPLPHGQPPVELDPVNVSTQITMIRTGWNAEQFGIVTVDPITNPAQCGTADGYVTDSTQPGYHTYYAAALLAFAERATVIVVVARFGCVANRPKLIGINIVR